MKKNRKTACCKRCGDEISALELTSHSDNLLCCWCQDMQLEAMEMRMYHLLNTKPLISLVTPSLINPQ